MFSKKKQVWHLEPKEGHQPKSYATFLSVTFAGTKLKQNILYPKGWGKHNSFPKNQGFFPCLFEKTAKITCNETKTPRTCNLHALRKFRWCFFFGKTPTDPCCIWAGRSPQHPPTIPHRIHGTGTFFIPRLGIFLMYIIGKYTKSHGIL